METYTLETEQVLIEFIALGGVITKMINKKNEDQLRALLC